MASQRLFRTAIRIAATILALSCSVYCVDPLADRRNGAAGILTPVGLWHALRVKGGAFCGLRNFPPLPDGFGTSRLYCISNEYEHFWMFRISKASGPGAPSSGDPVLLSAYQPVFHYCRHEAQVVCGVDKGEATRFTVEKESGSGKFKPSRDTVYLKVGPSYCGLTGSGHGQQLQCAFGRRSAATPFQLPASNYASVQLVNALTNNTCGGDFYGQYANPGRVSCGPPFAGLAANLTVALRNASTAAAPEITPGAAVALKTYEDLYTYQVGVWKVNDKGQVYSDSFDPSAADPTQWFSLHPLPADAAATTTTITTTTTTTTTTSETAASGTATKALLASGAAVALRSGATGRFCGLAGPQQPWLACDAQGPLRALPPGYRFTFLSDPASLRPYSRLAAAAAAAASVTGGSSQQPAG